jgi:hypothetical protein
MLFLNKSNKGKVMTYKIVPKEPTDGLSALIHKIHESIVEHEVYTVDVEEWFLIENFLDTAMTKDAKAVQEVDLADACVQYLLEDKLPDAQGFVDFIHEKHGKLYAVKEVRDEGL